MDFDKLFIDFFFSMISTEKFQEYHPAEVLGAIEEFRRLARLLKEVPNAGIDRMIHNEYLFNLDCMGKFINHRAQEKAETSLCPQDQMWKEYKKDFIKATETELSEETKKIYNWAHRLHKAFGNSSTGWFKSLGYLTLRMMYRANEEDIRKIQLCLAQAQTSADIHADILRQAISPPSETTQGLTDFSTSTSAGMFQGQELDSFSISQSDTFISDDWQILDSFPEFSMENTLMPPEAMEDDTSIPNPSPVSPELEPLFTFDDIWSELDIDVPIDQ